MKPAFRAGMAHARVPATSANLGPGFDALGLALTLHDDVLARVGEDGVLVDIAGEGEDLARNEDHLVVSAMRAAFDRLGGQPRGIELSCANRIPHGRGLGSSAAAIVAGVLLARALVVGGAQELPDEDVLALAGEMEGHLDNVAACLLGGLTIAWDDQGTGTAARVECAENIAPTVFVPGFAASTSEARAALPDQVPHADAAFTAGRAALLVAALTSRPDLALVATDDRLHQPYRQAAMPESAALVDALRANGHPAAVSGAGPTVIVLARDAGERERAAALAPQGWRCLQLDIDADGAQLIAPAKR